MRTAIVYDRVVKWGGAERLLLVLHNMFPDASLFTSLYNKESASWARIFPKVITSPLNTIPFLNTNHEKLAVFMPIVFENFDLSDYDLVISVTSEAAKGIITKPDTIHICICLTPTRYLWSGFDEYFSNKFNKFVAYPFIAYLRRWDRVAARKPDKIFSISKVVQKRVKKYYGLDSEILYPPLTMEGTYKKSSDNSKKYYLVVSRLVPYKKIGLVIETFNALKKDLVIVGTGRQEAFLRRNAKKNIIFVKNLTDGELAGYYQGAKALIMPQEEDFGLSAVEAQSFGVPVIAFQAGGALDIVKEGKTGIFFQSQSVEALKQAIEKCEQKRFSRREITENSKRFSERQFKMKVTKAIGAL